MNNKIIAIVVYTGCLIKSIGVWLHILEKLEQLSQSNKLYFILEELSWYIFGRASLIYYNILIPNYARYRYF